MDLPAVYSELTWQEKREVREQYAFDQDYKCMYCKGDLEVRPKKDRKINWRLFPPNFLKYPVHLQHNHKTGLTEGVIHAYCNAVLWQYHGR